MTATVIDLAAVRAQRAEQAVQRNVAKDAAIAKAQPQALPGEWVVDTWEEEGARARADRMAGECEGKSLDPIHAHRDLP
jgi:hypothetical protein